MIFPSKLLTGLSKILWNLDEFPASLDPKLTIWKINGVKLWQNDFQSSKALSNESNSKDRRLYNPDEKTMQTYSIYIYLLLNM